MSLGEFVRRVLIVFLILLLITGIWAARSTLLLGFAAALIAVGISIPSGWLQRRGLRRSLSMALSSLAVGAFAVFLVLLVLPRLLEDLFVLLGSIPQAIGALSGVYESLRTSSEFLGMALAPLPDAETTTLTVESAQEILNQLVNASLAIAPTLLGGVGTMVATLVNVGFVIFISIFFLIDPKSYVKASLYLVPARHHQHVVHIWNELYHTARTWITALSFSISITVALVWVILGVLLGMPNALVVAVFAGLATFIPNIGVFLPLIPIAVFTLASANPAGIFLYIPVYLVIQLVESNVITPSIVKAELEIPAGALMLFQLLITLAFGALGLLLAVPLLAILIVLVRELYSYDMLGLRQRAVALTTNEAGQLMLDEESVALGREEFSLKEAETGAAALEMGAGESPAAT